jgi:predicted protein tyrosine phosphatase
MNGPDESPLPSALPFSGSYWARPGELLAGCYPGALGPAEAEAKLAGLLRCDVTHMVNLMTEVESDFCGRRFAEYWPQLRELAAKQHRRVTFTRRPIPDMDVPSVAEMQRILDFIDAALGDGVVYVHCLAGKGRTGTVVGCHLARHGLAAGQDALDLLRQLTRHSADYFWPTPQTEAQRDFVRNWRYGQ